ncbi:MAG TPA: sulfurtransferase TusA family protein [Planctomycetota bacterium]|nr:sulfurtransferase TusA family protein [Planctomycetota bacterium]
MELPDDDVLPVATIEVRTKALQQLVHGLGAAACHGCGAGLCGHEAVLAVVFGYQNQPRCAACLAREQHEPDAALRERALQWIVRRDCFLHVWRQAGAREGQGPVDRPHCLFGAAAAAPPVAAAPAAGQTMAPPHAAAHYDAGELGCGDLVLELRGALRALEPGAVLHVTARDPAAPVDLPAWCGLCGHTLLHASHPQYWIQRKRD